MRRLISAAFMCLCLATVSAPAQADDAVAAKAKYESGVRHFDLAEFEPALADFKEAYRNKPDPVFLYNIAQCHRKLGHADEAISFYQTYLRKAPDAKNREEVERRISELQAIRNAESASVATSGKPQPVPAAVEPQKQAVVETATQPAPVPSMPAAAPMTAPPVTPVAAPTIATSPTSAPLESISRYETAPPVTPVAEISPPSPLVKTTSAGHGMRVAGVACGAVGLASIGTGVYFYTRAVSLSDKVSTSDTPSPSDHQAGKDAQTMQWVFYSAGVAAVGTGAILYFLGRRDADSATTTTAIVPLVGPSIAGLSARGAF